MLSIYQLKFSLRKLLMLLIPLMRNVSPNWISLAHLPVGALTVYVYYLAMSQPLYYFVGIALLFLQMFLATFDGLIAQIYNKGSPRGEILNRVTPEISDIALLGMLAYFNPSLWALGALCAGWFVSFLGFVGLSIQKPILRIGPVDRTDRQLALMVCSLLAYWPIGFDPIQVFFIWCSIGGLLTIILRLNKLTN